MFRVNEDLKKRVWISENDEKFMLYDRNTGNVHFADDEKALKDIEEDLLKLPELKSVFAESMDNSFKINLSTICNLHCDYCFRDKESHIPTDVDTAKKIIDYILDVSAPGLDFYSFAFNMTSEALFELEKLKQIKAYLDERINICFDLKEISSIEKGLIFLGCFDSSLVGSLEKYDSEILIVKKLNELLKLKNLKDYFVIPQGMKIPDWERNQLEKMNELTEKEIILANRRFLEFLFPETFAHKANYVFYICTNGTICSDEVISFFKEIELKRICISLDGPAAIHDKHRYFYNGNTSHAGILKNIRKFKSEGFEIEIASVITRDFMKPLKIAEYLMGIGVNAIGMNVVRAGKPSSLNLEDGKKLLNGYKDLFERIYQDAVKGDFSLIELLKNDICFSAVKHVMSKNRFVKRCKWNEELVFDSKGDIYPCDYFIGKKGFCRGSINSSKLKDIGKDKIFADEREPCKDCWSKYMCAGTCFHNSFVRTGDLSVADPVECLISKGIRKMGLELVHRLYLAGVNLFEFAKRIGFYFDSELNFSKVFSFENGISYEFDGTLVKFEKEISKLFLFIEKLNLHYEKEIYVTVENIKNVGKSQMIHFVVMIQTKEKIENEWLKGTNYNSIKNYESGFCISIECNSDDDEMESAKNKLYEFAEMYKVPVNGNLIYKGNIEAFLGVKEFKMNVFMCQKKNVI